MTHSKRLGTSLAAVVAIALSGCASTTVKPVYESSNLGSPPPNLVMVYRFAVSADEVTENQGFFARAQRSLGSTPLSQDEQQTARQAADRLAKDLVTGIQGLGLRAQMATPPQKLARKTEILSEA